MPQIIASFDINYNRVGFMTALEMAACLLNQGVYRHIAIVFAHLVSQGLNWDDEESTQSFSDGAVCVIKVITSLSGDKLYKFAPTCFIWSL
ncbi:hypothetical protein [Snodgrassella alvi]|uniref:hypothetical protein n=1 Tax=Snodgrassella alvi TaxID=1196083 RepID=UPI000C1E9D26|nr:hypothetical protein [Snodgrassella alvi]